MEEENATEKVSPAGDEVEDIPSDFFDDFNKEDFMEGLSVIDSWDDEDKAKKARSKRIDMETLDSVNDLRELINESKEKDGYTVNDNKYKWSHREDQPRRSTSSSRLNDFIKPGSRRDPNKTNEAIKKDKEEKVKEMLAKQLESADDLRPPGTELDDFFDENKPKETRKVVVKEVHEKPTRPSPQGRQFRYSPPRRRSPRRSPRQRWSPRRQPRWSPRRQPPRYSPHRSNWRPSPTKSRRNFHSPTHKRSPRRFSPRRRHYSRSPQRRTYDSRRSRSRSPLLKELAYLRNAKGSPSSRYPPSYQPELTHYQPAQGNFSVPTPAYPYPQVASSFTAGYTAPYDYGAQPVIQPQLIPLPGSAINPVPPPIETSPVMVPAPNTVQSVPVPAASLQPTPLPVADTKTPYDALAQLVAEGKISQEDYLKLAPNKGASSSGMDTKSRVMVLSRCNTAMTKLAKLLLPNRLMMNNNLVGPEPKSLAPKYCSPLKRQATVEFHFTKPNGSSNQQDKQLVDSILSTLDLDNVVTRSKKKPPKDTKDAAVQTTKPFCDLCDIRESTRMNEMSTFTEPEYFTSTVHTQVVEQDLVNSKTIFNPTGSGGDSASISIAHMTPAQLVSQLAARAKTLKQTDPVPQQPPALYPRRNPNYDGRGGQYQNYNNYRY